jgi:serine-type D-Ala-D-Ala carboxypeptidase (penicillin-binding protein 5/6)
MERRKVTLARFFSLVAILSLSLLSVGREALAQSTPDLGISAKRYIVIDAETGEIFLEHNADEEVALASLTKVFTTIEALERGSLTDRITTRSSDLYDSNSTLMGFGPGETFSLEDLLYGMMLPSGNDAAHAIARHLGTEPGLSDDESVERFMGFINERIRNMGLTQTQLLNPHGWGVDGHYSTARDIATFTMYALQYPKFRQVIGTTQHTTANGYYTVTNTNRLLNAYPGLVGGKTGFDNDSGYCLVEVAERNGNTMISVTLDGTAPDVWYQDNAILLDYAFEQKERRAAAGEGVAGPVLAFRDPDAALILASARSDGSLGQPSAETEELALASDSDVSAEEEVEGSFVPGNVPSQGNEDDGTDYGTWAGAGVAALVIAGALVFRTLSSPHSQGPSSPSDGR